MKTVLVDMNIRVCWKCKFERI